MYHLRILDDAIRDLEWLDKTAGWQVVKRILWLASNLDNIQPETLSGEFTEFYKLRAGDYRVLYQVQHDEQTVVVHAIGHRKDIYRTR